MSYHKKIIVGALLAAAGVVAAQAQEPALTVLHADGAERVQYQLDNITHITFSGDDMIVTHADGTATHPVGNIAELRFDIELGADALEQVVAPGVTVSASGGIVTITADGDTALAVSVFDTAGRMLQNFTATSTATVDMTALPTGIYIIKANDKVIKYRN